MRLPAASVWITCLAASGAGCAWDWDRFLPRAGVSDAAPRADALAWAGGDAAPLAAGELKPTGGPAGDWLLMFRDECEGSTLSNNWNTLYFHSGNFFDHYSWSGSAADAANVTVGGGSCQIRLDRKQKGDRKYTTGVLDSSGKFEQLYGYFEVRLRAAKGASFRTVAQLSHSTEWPPQIDFARIAGNNVSRVNQIAWFDDSSGQAKNESQVFQGPDFSQEFHIFGVHWRADEISFYVDGVRTGTLSRAAPAGTRLPAKLEITAHVNGELAEAPDATTVFPSFVAVDWVRAWRQRLAQ